MADSMSYSTGNHYLPTHTQYYSTPHINHGHVHIVSPPLRQDATQRKRPKYTRSKTGCLTCRVKKIKCDETKPNCMRCTHGQRDCTWPEGVPARKKATTRKDSVDGRPSTAGSSGLSEGSTPPTREHTPPRRSQLELGLIMPPSSRRTVDPYMQLRPMTADLDLGRRPIHDDRTPAYPHHSPTSNLMSMIPEPPSYASQPRYDTQYSASPHASSPRHSMSAGFRPMNTHSLGQWSSPDPLDTYFPNLQERGMVGHHAASHDSHHRYQ